MNWHEKSSDECPIMPLKHRFASKSNGDKTASWKSEHDLFFFAVLSHTSLIDLFGIAHSRDFHDPMEKIKQLRRILCEEAIIDMDTFLRKLNEEDIIDSPKEKELRRFSYKKKLTKIYFILSQGNPHESLKVLIKILKEMRRDDIIDKMKANAGMFIDSHLEIEEILGPSINTVRFIPQERENHRAQCDSLSRNAEIPWSAV